MSEIEETKERFYEILVYGAEKLNLKLPNEPLRTRNWCLFFEPFNTTRRFNEFDGVILYQGIFEHFEWKRGVMDRYLDHTCDNDELDKRKKEAQLLAGNGGFLCFLLNRPFVDREDGTDFMGSDLAKYHLLYPRFERENFQQRIAHLNIKSDEFRKFLEIYGAASSYFDHYNESLEWIVIAEAVGRVAGMIIQRTDYFIPTLVPDNRPDTLREYFALLADALTSTNNKLHQELPGWVTEFSFSEERNLDLERVQLEARIAEIARRKAQLAMYKSVLSLSSDALVASVVRVFKDGFGIAVDTKDELREDFKLLDDEGLPFCICEVKGTNKGVNREYINQADSHRERSGFGAIFPALLIVNTHIRNARSVAEKDQQIASEQVMHARKMNVLVLRTLDLLGLLRLYLSGQIKVGEIKELLTSAGGWLRVNESGYNIISGQDSEEMA